MGLIRLQGILTRCLLPLSLCRTKQLTRVILYHNVAVCELPRRLFIHAVWGQHRTGCEALQGSGLLATQQLPWGAPGSITALVTNVHISSLVHQIGLSLSWECLFIWDKYRDVSSHLPWKSHMMQMSHLEQSSAFFYSLSIDISILNHHLLH